MSKVNHTFSIDRSETLSSGQVSKRDIFLAQVPPATIIDHLEREEIHLSFEASEVSVEYRLMNQRKKVIVPLGTVFPQKSDPILTAYYLRAPSLEVSLRDFYRSLPEAQGTFGSPVTHTYGVHCVVIHTGELEEGIRVIETVERVVRHAYAYERVQNAEVFETVDLENLAGFLRCLPSGLEGRRG